MDALGIVLAIISLVVIVFTLIAGFVFVSINAHMWLGAWGGLLYGTLCGVVIILTIYHVSLCIRKW